MELDALTFLASSADTAAEMEQAWEQVGDLARRIEAWPTVVESLRTRAILFVGERSEAAWALLEQAGEIADARGLNEALAWIDYGRTEAGLVSGEWTAALEAALRGLERAEQNAYHRAAVRTWFAVVPIVFAQARADLMERGFRWWQQRDRSFSAPTSPYARIMRAAMELRFAAAGFLPPFVPEPVPLMESFAAAQEHLPSWIAASETVLLTWLRVGELDAVREALQRWSEGRFTASPLAHGAEALVRARLLQAEDADSIAAAEAARHALDLFRVARALWWIVNAIQVLEGIGKSTTELTREARVISRRLRLASAGGRSARQLIP